ncbi:Nucleoside diphosphate kinase [Fundidesulfovibrio magnetotacticus]|uniref:Nucleoside diphosphate kinase n=1 Tax=Fundidesulfovibrio magnetotacticus TaxID=2730080 RepID=A0A6V8LKB0_9BACT|nr:nucleoside-diphosphate kinase [Fundidesulfovibrio magnetotacticus]GFK93143.1 Nucleoside diphosphate kinase [Fundidesulfovibrio magnetotacticus]
MELTLCLIKPDAVRRNLIGSILFMVEKAGLKVMALKMLQLDKRQAEGFYHVHRERPFFGELTEYMASGPIVAVVLAGDDAIKRYRELMGATDPTQAAEGTIRKVFAVSKQENSVHGSDAPETAAFEISFFFNAMEMVG